MYDFEFDLDDYEYLQDMYLLDVVDDWDDDEDAWMWNEEVENNG